jgi:hypothetical protein
LIFNRLHSIKSQKTELFSFVFCLFVNVFTPLLYNLHSIMNDELARIQKEAIMACFKVLSQHSSTGTEKYNEKTSESIAGLETKNLTLELPNTN